MKLGGPKLGGKLGGGMKLGGKAAPKPSAFFQQDEEDEA